MITHGVFKKSIANFLSPISHLLDDSSISEIMINGPYEIWIERSGVLCQTEDRFSSRQALDAAITNISQFAGRPVNSEQPILEASLPDGSRLAAILQPIAKNGPAVSIRRFSKSTLTISKLVNSDSLSKNAALYLARAVALKKNILVSGGTGSGKTSLLCALSSFFSDDERIVVIEDTHELQIQKNHVIYLESRCEDERGKGRITIRDLLHTTLRLRPDRIVVGEVRGKEALDLIQAMTSGHAGSITTAHANNVYDVANRLETMALMANSGLPHEAIKKQIASAVDIVIQAERTSEGKRQISQISTIKGLNENGIYNIENIFLRDSKGDLRMVKKNQRKQK